MRLKDEKWPGAKRPVYLRWMKIFAVLAVTLNLVAELHYRRLTAFQLPSTIAALVSYLAVASFSLFIAGVGVWLAMSLNERQKR